MNISRHLNHLKSMKLSPEIVVLVIFGQVVFICLLMFLSYPPFQSDESVYSYASLALTKGLVPYREIALYQPPIQYMVMAGLLEIFGSNLMALRIFNLFMLEATIFASYIASDRYFRRWEIEKHKVLALGVSLIFGVYSTLLFFKFGFNESLFILFSLCAFALFMDADDNRFKLFACGLFTGLSILTKYYGVFFAAALALVILIQRKKWSLKDKAVRLAYIGMGVAVVGGLFLFAIYFVWSALPNFLTQTVYWYNFDKFPATPEQQLASLSWIFDSYTLPIVAALIGILVLAVRYKKARDPIILSPVIIIAVATVFMMRSKWIFLHHFYFFLPFVAICAVVAFAYLFRVSMSPAKNRQIAVVTITAVIILSAAFYNNASAMSSFLPGYYVPNTQNAMYRYIGLVVKNLTSDGDLIWSSEGAIGFFADRIIAAPNSTSWPVRAFYTEVFSYDFLTYRGNESGYPEGAVKIAEFTQSWEENQVKVLILIRGEGWVPYPDELMWHGFQGQTGIKSYVETNYELYAAYAGKDESSLGHLYEVWVRKS